MIIYQIGANCSFEMRVDAAPLTTANYPRASPLLCFSFTEIIKNVTLSSDPAHATEGSGKFTLQYRMQQGVVEGQMWFFNGMALSNNSRYSLEQRSLAIRRPNRTDTGQYKLVLTNPFSRETTYKNISVLCKITDRNGSSLY